MTTALDNVGGCVPSSMLNNLSHEHLSFSHQDSTADFIRITGVDLSFELFFNLQLYK